MLDPWAVVFLRTGKKTPGGAGTLTGHTGHADAQRHTDQSHNQPNPPTTNTPHVSATTEAAADSTAASPKPTVLGEFSIQEKGIFYTRYHYISSYILIVSLCIICIIIMYLIYHVPRRHMIYRLYHLFSFVMLYHVISCRVFDDTWT